MTHSSRSVPRTLSLQQSWLTALQSFVKLLSIGTVFLLVNGTTGISRAEVFNVNVGDFFYSPTPLTIAAGDTVHWIWTADSGGEGHTVTSGGASGSCQESFDSDVRFIGATFDHTFNTAGTCNYYCLVHGTIMAGQVIVTGGGGGGGGGGAASGATAAASDFTGDGRDDLVVIDQEKGQFELFISSPTGLITPPTIIPPSATGYTPLTVAAGSFNSNQGSTKDLALVEKEPGGISVLSIYNGSGAGTFTLLRKRTVNGLDTPELGIRSIETGDFNGDGLTDLAVTGPIDGTTGDVIVKVLLGDGFGNFSNTSPFPPVGNVVVNPTAFALENGQTQTLTASVTNTLGTPLPNSDLTWTTSDPSICSIAPTSTTTDSTGLSSATVTAGAVGTATITVTAGDPSDSGAPRGTASCTVVVPQRDVSATSITASGLNVTTTVRNNGNVKLAPFRVGIYLSTDTVIDPATDYLVGTRTVTDLQAGASSTQGQTITVSAVPNGTYYIGVYADDLSQITETNETNNARSTTTTILVAPDLSANFVTGTISSTNLNISASVRNLGTKNADNVAVNFYLSTDPTITSADLLLCSTTLAAVAAGATQSANTTCPVASVPAGTYYVGMIVDPNNTIVETNEDNNVRPSTSTFTLAPDLAGITLTASLSFSGTSVTVFSGVRNGGNQAVNDVAVNFYLSTDTTITTADSFLCSRTISTLPIGGTNSASVTCSVTDQPSGTYYVGMIVDPDNTIVESNEANNTLATTTTFSLGPDLSFTTALSAFKSGANVNIGSGTVRNGGNQDASNILVNYYLSTDTTITTSDIFLCSRTIPTLAVSATSVTNLTCPLTGIPSGTYRVGGIVDPANAIFETNEGNNASAASSSTITVP